MSDDVFFLCALAVAIVAYAWFAGRVNQHDRLGEQSNLPDDTQ